MAESSEVTQLLALIGDGDRSAVDLLYPLVYDELRRIAQSQLAGEGTGHTLQATALVHEAYLRMVGQDRVQWQNRSHFMAVCAQAIRRILLDHARRRGRRKRGGGAQRVSLDTVAEIASEDPSTDVVALHEALGKLAGEDAVGASVVELRYFGGLKNTEVAEVLGVSVRSVERHWQYARAWLYRELAGGSADA